MGRKQTSSPEPQADTQMTWRIEITKTCTVRKRPGASDG